MELEGSQKWGMLTGSSIFWDGRSWVFVYPPHKGRINISNIKHTVYKLICRIYLQSIFDVRHTERTCVAKSLFRKVRAKGRSLDTPSKNISTAIRNYFDLMVLNIQLKLTFSLKLFFTKVDYNSTNRLGLVLWYSNYCRLLNAKSCF